MFNKKLKIELEALRTIVHDLSIKNEVCNDKIAQLTEEKCTLTQKNYIADELIKSQQNIILNLNKKLVIDGPKFLDLISANSAVEDLNCINLYLADRHPTVYEIVHIIVIKEKTISNCHFEHSCFDNVHFDNVTFCNICFYNSFFEDVKFNNCTFNRCDFTRSRGCNLYFNNCINLETNLSDIRIIIQEEEYEE